MLPRERPGDGAVPPLPRNYCYEPSDTTNLAIPNLRASAANASERAEYRGMHAQLLVEPGQPLQARELPDPTPAPGQLRIRVSACAVCRTDLHLRDAEIEAPKLPVILGHQIVGRTDDGRRVGVPWLGWTDGSCRYCDERPREPVRRGPLHRTRHRRRLRAADRRRRALLPGDPRGDLRHPGRAAAVRRADRLPGADARRRRRAARPVRVRLGRASDLPGRRPPGP